MEDVTFIIKTFERHDSLILLMNSIRKFYPYVKVIIADDSKNSNFIFNDCNLEYYSLPFDSGVSYGRNFLIDKVTTKYFLTLDDDFLFNENTKIEIFKDILDNNNIDLVSGDVFFQGSKTDYKGIFELTDERKLLLRMNENRGYENGYPLYDIVLQFFLARTDKIRDIRWDPDLKTQDHEDFFYRGNGLLNITHTEEVSIGHPQARTPYYDSFRHRNYWPMVFEKNNLNGFDIVW